MRERGLSIRDDPSRINPFMTLPPRTITGQNQTNKRNLHQVVIMVNDQTNQPPNQTGAVKTPQDKMSLDKMSRTKRHWTKCLADKMSQDKTPCRQNVTRQNALQTKCHRTKSLADKTSRDKMPCRQNVTHTKCHSDKMSLRKIITYC